MYLPPSQLLDYIADLASDYGTELKNKYEDTCRQREMARNTFAAPTPPNDSHVLYGMLHLLIDGYGSESVLQMAQKILQEHPHA